ncbi:rod shape-determining protein MreD [Bacillus spongiae]|uniref:Rod shape-determining protein MreD n=1 Tax=Bacillus spongiae TaxID=2683610 RepID=A0ABU8H8U6_9BACI
MMKFLLPIVVTLVFYSESIFVMLFPPELFGKHTIVVPHFLLLLLCFIGIYLGKKTALIYAVIFGLLFDLYYTGIFGVYLYLFPIMVFLVIQIMRVVNANVFVSSAVSLLAMTMTEFAVFFLYLLLQKTGFTVNQFIEWRLFPTLLVNAAALLVFSYPTKVLLFKVKKHMNNE